MGTTRKPAFYCFILIVFGMYAMHFGLFGICISGIILTTSLIFIHGLKGSRILILALVTVGMFLEFTTRTMTPPRELSLPRSITAHGVIDQPIRRNPDYCSADFTLLDSGGVSTSFRVRAYFANSLGIIAEGQRFRVRGRAFPLEYPRNPGATDWDAALSARGCLARVFVDSVDSDQKNDLRSLPLRTRIRSHLNDVLQAAINDPEGTLASAMILGFREEIHEEIMSSFRNAGIVHVLAVSGLHVGIIVGVLFFAGTIFLPGYRMPALFALGGLILYVFVVGPYASILRSSVMAAALLLGLTIGRRSDPLNSLSVAGLILLISRPAWLWNPGFQLSFGATAGILFFTPRILAIVRPGNKAVSWLTGAVAASLGAQLGIFPVVMFYFRQWPVYGLLANIPAVLLMTVLIWSAILVLATAHLWGIMTLHAASLARWSAKGLLTVAEVVSRFPYSMVSWGTACGWFLVLIWALGLILLIVPRQFRLAAGVITTLIVFNIWLIWGIIDPWSRPRDRIICLHVDQGNAIVLESRRGHLLFIDPGSIQSRKLAVSVLTDYLNFRNARHVVDCGVSSCSYTRSGTLPLLCESGIVRHLYLPPACSSDSACAPMVCAWEDVNGFYDFRIQVFKRENGVVDGILIETRSGLRFLVSGEWGWSADSRLAADPSIGDIDVLYVGPGRDHAPSHLLLRKVRPEIIVAGGTGTLEQGARARISRMGTDLRETTGGAVIIEDSGSHATIRQIKRS